jgi:hypothetical protein
MPTAERLTIGWDIGGAHVKACLLQRGQVIDAAQWGCSLWQGLDHLARALEAARARWPGLGAAQHAVTMTGEMVDLFPDREDASPRRWRLRCRYRPVPCTSLPGTPAGARPPTSRGIGQASPRPTGWRPRGMPR